VTNLQVTLPEVTEAKHDQKRPPQTYERANTRSKLRSLNSECELENV